jgi:hypothetical protein
MKWCLYFARPSSFSPSPSSPRAAGGGCIGGPGSSKCKKCTKVAAGCDCGSRSRCSALVGRVFHFHTRMANGDFGLSPIECTSGGAVSPQISPEGIARVPAPTQLGPSPAAEPPRGRLNFLQHQDTKPAARGPARREISNQIWWLGAEHLLVRQQPSGRLLMRLDSQQPSGRPLMRLDS